MNVAILSIAAAALLSACATPAAEVAAGPDGPRADFSRWSCREIAAELKLTRRAYSSATRRDDQPLGGKSVQAFLSPASYSSAAPKSSAKLRARLEDLRKASRAKRCRSELPESATA